MVVDGRIEIQDRPVPTPGPGEVLVRVAGAGVNRADLMQRAGFYPAPPGSPADIPGLEFAGTVEALGPDVTTLDVGARVFGVVGGGGQAEYLTVHASHCAPVPSALDLVVAGGIPEAFVTAHDAMVTRGRVAAGEIVLIHAIGSGVGTAGVQLAHAFGAQCVGTARTPTKLERCADLGLEHGVLAISGSDGRLDVAATTAAVRAVAPDGVDVVLDLVGGAYVELDVQVAAPSARIVLVGTLAGGRTTLDILTTMQRRLELHGTVLRPRNVVQKAAATDAFVRDVVPLLADGRIEPIVERVLPLADAQAAYDLLATDTTFGTLILDCA